LGSHLSVTVFRWWYVERKDISDDKSGKQNVSAISVGRSSLMHDATAFVRVISRLEPVNGAWVCACIGIERMGVVKREEEKEDEEEKEEDEEEVEDMQQVVRFSKPIEIDGFPIP
ncbi:hypothetical protein V1477_001277, partial [Vespula maculifrons]